MSTISNLAIKTWLSKKASISLQSLRSLRFGPGIAMKSSKIEQFELHGHTKILDILIKCMMDFKTGIPMVKTHKGWIF